MILVLGGHGQLGQELQRHAMKNQIALTALSHAQADIASSETVEAAIRHYKPDVVVNAAAYTNVDQSEDEPAIAWRVNADGPAAIALACERVGLPLIHISSDYVFDGRKIGAYEDSDPVAPIGAYGRSKAAGEAAVRDTTQKHLIIRTAWVYGEFGKNFLKTILRLSGEHDQLRIVADQHGCPTSTRSLAAAILGLAPRLSDGDAPFGTYHFCGSGVTTWHGFAERIVEAQARHTGRKPSVIPITTYDYPTKAIRPANSALDCTRFAGVFGISPMPWDIETEHIVEAIFHA